MSILEKTREINADTLLKYLPQSPLNNLPVLVRGDQKNGNDFSERELLYKVLFDMKKDMADMKMLINEIMQHSPTDPGWQERKSQLISRIDMNRSEDEFIDNNISIQPSVIQPGVTLSPVQSNVEVEESLSLIDKEKEFIQKALLKHKGRRKNAAKELGISERTLYRKMNEYGLH
jgi:DNA-binding NtrC family response regulator